MRKPVSTDQEKAPDSLALEIGKEIHRALAVKSMTVTKLHQETGISRTVLQGYLKGRYKPGARELRLLSQALDCSPNRLLFGRESIRERGYLDELVGDADTVMNAAKIAVICSVLTLEEQRAALTLLALMAEHRTGGRVKLAEALKATDQMQAVLEASGPALAGRLDRLVTPAEVAAIEAASTGNPGHSGAPPKRRPTARKEPGK